MTDEETLVALRASVEALKASTVAELKAAEAARDAALARVGAVEGEREAARTEGVALRADVERLKAERDRVPAGVGERQAVDLSGLTPGEKIRYGLSIRQP